MVPVEYINLGASLCITVIQYIFSYYDKKDFMERFQKYRANIDIQIRQEIKIKIKEINKGLKNEVLGNLEDNIRKLADRLADAQGPAREYLDSYKLIKFVYLLLAASTIASLFSIFSPSNDVLNITHSTWGFMFLICAICLLVYIIYTLHKISEKVIASELKISLGFEN